MEKGGAPEITPAMIEAGARCLWGCDVDCESSFDLAKEVFCAMLQAKLQEDQHGPEVI